MIQTDLKDIQKMCKGFGLDEKHYDIKVSGVSTDSRDMENNKLFIPLIGDNFNGHNFLKSAIDNGAVAALWQEDQIAPEIELPLIYVKDTLDALQNLAKAYRESLDIKVIGITGSDGKTSTKDILSGILNSKYKTHGNKGNLNNYIGVPLTLLDMEEDTKFAVIEMGVSHLGDMDSLSSIVQPDIGIITNIGESHLEEFGSIKNIAIGKMEMLDHIKPGGLYLYNGDDELLASLSKDIKGDFKVQSFGINKDNDHILEPLETNENGSLFKIPSFSDKTYSIPLLGKHQVFNGGVSIIAAKYLGIDYEDIQNALDNIVLTGMRQEIIEENGITILNDSYKSNPSSLKSALETFNNLEGYNQKILILGDMLGLADKEREMHEEMNKYIDEDQVDYLITIGPASKYLGDVAKNKLGDENVLSFNDKSGVSDSVKEILKDNPLILIKASRLFELETLISEIVNNE